MQTIFEKRTAKGTQIEVQAMPTAGGHFGCVLLANGQRIETEGNFPVFIPSTAGAPAGITHYLGDLKTGRAFLMTQDEFQVIEAGIKAFRLGIEDPTGLIAQRQSLVLNVNLLESALCQQQETALEQEQNSAPGDATLSARLEQARQALRAFDAAHPGVTIPDMGNTPNANDCEA